MKAGWTVVAMASVLLPGCRRAPEVTGASAAVGDVTIRDGVAWGLASSRSSTFGFRVSAAVADTLIAVESPDGPATLHTTLDGRMVDLAVALVAPIGGGLGYVAIVAACTLAALSGSAVADAAALAALLLPMMVAAGHDRARSAGLIASAGIIAPVIPPSIGFVIFGVAANVSISKLFLAGIVPGLLLGASLWVTWWWLVRKEKVVPPPRRSRGEVAQAFRRSTWALVLPVIVIVGLKMGVFTPTEAAVVRELYALAVSKLVYRALGFRDLYPVVLAAA